MNKAEFVPAIGEQFNSVWQRGLKYKGNDNKEYDMKFFTKNSHFELDIGLQCCFYGINGVGKQCEGKDLTYREMIGFPKDKTLIGDSAGYQVASFKKRGEVCNIKPMDSLRWQEENCDIMMNLDVPPTLGKVAIYSEFQDALKTSIKNFHFFQNNRKNYDAKLYNVLHGENLKLMNEWYSQVKDFKFDGWAVGMKPPYDPMIQAMGFMKLYLEGEFDNNKSYGLHLFGTSGKHVVPTIVYMAKKLKNVRVTYDSSSYNIGSIYRTYYMPFDIGPHLSFGDKFSGDKFNNREAKNPNLKELPCQCPVCSSIKDIHELNTTDIYAGTLISLHNMYQYSYYNNILNKLVGDHDVFIDYLKKINISEKALKSIEYIDFAEKKGLEQANKKFEKWLIPQEVNKKVQSNLYGFGK